MDVAQMDVASKADVEVEGIFVAAGCNRVVNVVSWGACGLVSYGAQNAVAIFCPKSARVLTTLPGHKAFVNCTYWLSSRKFSFKEKGLDFHFLLSGDADGVIILWEYSLANNTWRKVLQLPQPHKKGITCITGIMASSTHAMFASTSSDCTVALWELGMPSHSEDKFRMSHLETISVGSKPMVTMSLAELPGSYGDVVLAMGGLDNKIHLYCRERDAKFVHACELKAHTDWIRSLDFTLPLCMNGEDKCILLASSSQDKGIRIWKIAPRNSSSSVTDMPSKEGIGLTSYIEGPTIVTGCLSYQISLESLLIGHEDWVYSVEWHPPIYGEGSTCHQPQSLLSASMDKTMMIWQPEKKTGLWMNIVTVGELNHSALGFYGGHWNPDGTSILSHGYGGAFHLWRTTSANMGGWLPQKVPSGHFASVTDIAWARSGEYLLTVGHDQTCRIFAPWHTSSSENEGTWHEIARPQVHGHDINCVAVIQDAGNYRFVSGADEKVSRVFEAPLSFLKTLNSAGSRLFKDLEIFQQDNQILGANMSALGLSQKPIYTNVAQKPGQNHEKDGFESIESVPDAVPAVLTEPPIEDQLAYHTLWPESHKLYGHGNEIFSLSCDHQGKLIASSCKAQSSMVAEVWLWEVGSWKAVGRLQCHSLTVTQMEFSHDDSMLLTVSRDRQFSVFTIKRGPNEIDCQLLTKKEAHKRIIWSCSWNPFGHQFATGSRDKFVKIWAIEDDSSVNNIATLPQFSSSVTALSWIEINRQKNQGLLAVGMEDGLIQLWTLTVNKNINYTSVDATLATICDPFICHVSTVNRLSWRRCEMDQDSRKMQLASCGADQCVRVFNVAIN